MYVLNLPDIFKNIIVPGSPSPLRRMDLHIAEVLCIYLKLNK